ncbi:MAG: hypothetical protein U5M53_03345 [Rhodoferax sp.]|nr:hypothetical protein [Rhodoferax sp.]
MLHEDLKQIGVAPRTFPFKKGNDIVKLVGDGKIETAFLGDVQTVNTLVHTPTFAGVWVKEIFLPSSPRDYTQLETLKGKRRGYSAGSSSHLVLPRDSRQQNDRV